MPINGGTPGLIESPSSRLTHSGPVSGIGDKGTRIHIPRCLSMIPVIRLELAGARAILRGKVRSAVESHAFQVGCCFPIAHTNVILSHPVWKEWSLVPSRVKHGTGRPHVEGIARRQVDRPHLPLNMCWYLCVTPLGCSRPLLPYAGHTCQVNVRLREYVLQLFPSTYVLSGKLRSWWPRSMMLDESGKSAWPASSLRRPGPLCLRSAFSIPL